jgi:hypothetical protein
VGIRADYANDILSCTTHSSVWVFPIRSVCWRNPIEVPLITNFLEDKLEPEDPTPALSDRAFRVSQNDNENEGDTELQTPGLNRDFYNNVGWFQFGVIPLTLSLILLLTNYILLSVAKGGDAVISFTYISWWILFFLPFLPCFYVLTCLTFEDMNSYPEKWWWKIMFHSLLMFVLFGSATFLIVLESYPELRSNNIFEAFIFKFASILLYGSFALGVYFLSSLTICIIGIKGNPRRESDTAMVNLLPIAASQDV